MEPKTFGNNNPEYQIQQAIIKELRMRGWYVIIMHASAALHGLPDLYCTHYRYGPRWLEVKLPKGSKFTGPQLENFPKMCANGSGVWVATSEVNVEQLLMKPSNFGHFLAMM